MKKLVLFSASLLMATVLMAQASVTSAFNANESGEYAKAAEYIEKAIENPKAIAKEKTWRYRGRIYCNIAKDSVLSAQYPQAIPTAIESLQKAMELDTRDSYKEENLLLLGGLQVNAGNNGINYFNKENYAMAAEQFLLSNQVSESFNVIDTTALFNAALSYERGDMMDEAIAMYIRTADMGYNVPNSYGIASRIEKERGNTDEALEILVAAREKFPNDQGLIIDQLNIYLTGGDYEQAEKNLQSALDKDPDNPQMLYAMGVVYDNLGKKEQAADAYTKALALKGDYFDANYNLGALYYNKAVEQIALANEIPMNQQSKFNAAIKEANATFTKALPYLEKALTIQPEDLGTLQSLKEIYYRQDKTGKVEEMDAKIKSIQG